MMRHYLPGWFLLAAISASSAFSPSSPMSVGSKIHFGLEMSRGSFSRRPQSVAPTMLVGAKEANEAIQFGLRKMASLPVSHAPCRLTCLIGGPSILFLTADRKLSIKQRRGTRPLTSPLVSSQMVASPPMMGVPTQSWKTSNRAQASTLGEELEPRTEVGQTAPCSMFHARSSPRHVSYS